ncbi:MAG: hypothetical protein ABSE46_07570 [Terracidiphilus sp.]
MKSLYLAIPLVLASLIAQTAHSQARLLVAQKGERSLAIVDPVAGTVLGSVPEGGTTGHEVIASPDGRLAYVPIYGDSGVGKPGTNGTSLVVIDIAAQKVIGSLDFGHGVRPHMPIFGPKDGLLYVTTELDHSISLIDPKSLKIVGAITTGQSESHMLALSHDGQRGYTANVGPGTVSVLDIPNRQLLAIIPISNETQRISITPDDRWVFTADQTQPRLAAIDTHTDQVAHWVPLEGLAYGTAPTLDGKFLLVTIPSLNKLAVIDIATMKVVRSIDTPADPEEVLAQPGNKTAWISSVASHTESQLDLATWQITRKIETGKGTDGIAWAAIR